MIVPEPLDYAARPLEVYVPRLAVDWIDKRPRQSVRQVDGSLAFVDISGFTKLTERLARRGQVGAEEMSDILDATFGALLEVARADGAELIKWGGDAVLLLYDAHDHAARAARSAFRMRKTLRALTQRPTSSGQVSLRMSVGIHSGIFDFFLVGDPDIHHELIVSGPSASMTAQMESVARAGQIAISDGTARLLPSRLLGARVDGGRLLRAEPALADLPPNPRTRSTADVAMLLPPPIRTHLHAASGESEHRAIAVAFVQFSGTDALLRQHGPDALAAALDECVRNVQDAARAHEVTFFESDINHDGGKIMLTAGAPRSTGDDEDRILRASRLIVERAGTLTVRIGVNRGYVFAGDFGPEFRRTYSVKGDAINLAARVMAKALPRQVLATRDTISRAATLFRTEILEPFLVKGKARPVHAISVGPVIGELIGEHDAGPFVGRELELARLDRALEHVRSGSGTFVDIVGEPGIGKSRLVEEFTTHAKDLPVLVGRGSSYQSATAYYPFRTLLRQALAARFGDSEQEESIAKLATEAPHLTAWLPLLGIPLDVELPHTVETRELDEQFRKAKLEETTVAALRELLPGPAVLVMENAHLIDDASADLLQHLEHEARERAWVVLITRRAQTGGYGPDDATPTYERIALGAIDPTAALQLVASATQTSPLTRQAMQAMVERADGNPLFLAGLALIAGRTGSVADLPESVEGVVTTQIDRLDPRDRTLLRYAAVLGVRFPESALREMLADRAFAFEVGAMDRLADFVDRDGASGFAFRHALIRDVAYAGLPFRLRREMHDRAGHALEARPGAASSEPELLSLHFFHAGSYDKAWHYSRLAGRRALGRYAYVQAGEFFERALDAARRGAAVTPSETAAALEDLGDVRTLAGSSRDAIDAYRRARRQRTSDVVASAGLRFKLAVIEQRLGRFTPSLQQLSRGLRELTGVDGTAAATARSKLATRYGFGRYLQGRAADAIRWCRIGAEEAQRAQDQAALAMAYNALFLAHLRAGRVPDEPYGDLALALYQKIDDLAGQGHCANNLAIAAHGAGRWTDAEKLFARAAEIFARIGDIANETNADYNRSDLLIRQGRFAVAEQLLQDVLRNAQAVADEELIALAVRELARAESGLGNHDKARRLFDDARQRLGVLGLGHEQDILDAARAEAHLRAGEPTDALALSVTTLTRPRTSDLTPTLHRLRATALLRLGRWDEAEAAVAAGVTADDDADGGYERAMLLHTQAAIMLARDPCARDRSRSARDDAAQILHTLGVVDSSSGAIA